MINDEISSDMALEAIVEQTNERIRMREEDILSTQRRKDVEEVKGKIKTLYFITKQYEWIKAKKELQALLEDL